MIPYHLDILLHAIHRDQRPLQRVRIAINFPRFAGFSFDKDEAAVSRLSRPARFDDGLECEQEAERGCQEEEEDAYPGVGGGGSGRPGCGVEGGGMGGSEDHHWHAH